MRGPAGTRQEHDRRHHAARQRHGEAGASGAVIASPARRPLGAPPDA
ncbi:hypothetical protein ACWEN4_13490 [Streptomyces violaceorubidus]